MATHDRRPVVRAPDEAWQRLGVLLQLRRADLGYRRRPAFTREHGINIRLVTDIENAYRPNTFLTPTLRDIAQAYAVTFGSLTAVLAGTADELTPAPPAAAAVPVVLPGRMPPMADAARIASARPYADLIWQRLNHLAALGVTDPDGTQVFGRAGADPLGYDGIGSPADAQTWDGTGARLDLPDRVWLIADMQRRDDGRGPGGAAGTAGA
jgi:hypothetical protein